MKKYIFLLILLFIPFQVFAQWGKLNDLKRNLIAYYPLDKDVLDYSGKSHHGTNYGATLRTEKDSCVFFYGINSGAYSFDGNDSISLGNSIIDTTKNMSVSMFIFNTDTASYLSIISDWIGIGWGINCGTVRGIDCFVFINATNYKITKVGSANSLNVRYHIIGIFFADGSQPKLYVNGVQYTATQNSGTVSKFPQNSAQNTLIGNTGGLTVPFYGLIDQLMIWERDISIEPQFMENLGKYKYGTSFLWNTIMSKFGLLDNLQNLR